METPEVVYDCENTRFDYNTLMQARPLYSLGEYDQKVGLGNSINDKSIFFADNVFSLSVSLHVPENSTERASLGIGQNWLLRFELQ